MSLFKSIELNMRMDEVSDHKCVLKETVQYLIFRHERNSTNEGMNSCREISIVTQMKEKL